MITDHESGILARTNAGYAELTPTRIIGAYIILYAGPCT